MAAFSDWDDVVAFCCALPGVEMASFWNHMVPKLNAKALASPGREPGSFCLMVGKAEKEMLLETDADTFWQTDHYRNYPAVLARFDTPAGDRIALYLRRRWWDVAKRAQRVAAGIETRP